MEKLKGKLEEEPETSQSHHQSDDSTNLQPPDYISKAQSLKEAGNKLFQRRDYENAMLKYREAIEVLPDSHVEVSHIRSNMASCYMHSEPGEYAKAIHECDLALTISPDYTKALLKRARCYEALNKLDSALRDVCLVSELDPNNPMASEIAVKLKRTLEGKGLMVKDSAIELPADYVEPVAAHLALWAKKGKARVKKKNRSIQVQAKSDAENAEKIINVKKSVKFVYSDDVRLAELPLNCTLFHLREVVHERFPSLRAVHIKYKDQEGDLVTITTDEELRMSEEVSSSLEKMRFYVVEVSPEQDPFFGRLVEMKKLRITADSFKAKANGKGRCKIEDWMVEFARLFKIQANIADSDDTTCLNLQELGMKLNSEAMEEVVTSEEAQLPFEKAAKQFQELVARSLLKLGHVHMTRARKRLSLLRSGEQVQTAYECALTEHAKAKEKYEEAMRVKPDLLEVFLALALQHFEEARLSWYYALVSHVDLKTWPYADVLQLYRSAKSNIKKSMEGLKNPESKGLDKAAKLKSWLDVLSCAVLYERSMMEYRLDLPTWQENLEGAVVILELAGTCEEDVAALIRDDYVTDNTLRDLRFHVDEVLQIFHEIYEAKEWRNGIPSDQFEEILKRRIANIFHVSHTTTT
ncbi:Octicosapeptide/Phox/Bem1p (PB1) domain-containing protein / TPR-containing protein [Raphanus sativus]|uniref:Protein PHOX3-like n=1 Tax=Raphanus sativus TaxID=3726 RepID=A0A9W3CV29_RAPSA|nr:protein PHOX3-like [Raphanus sativus]KAJ4868774.1 Octicosapeptide/Phox/Bem1p (PB1) domain-containing protein / TPR-containing protein [Raphanus sativus]